MSIRRLALAAIIVLAAVIASRGWSAPAQIAAFDWQPRSDWVNVKRDIVPAAVGDGVADDTAALQKALDGMRDGSTIYLPSGTYRITRTLLQAGPRHGALIVGNGRDTRLVWDGDPGGKMLRDTGAAYCNYRGIAFEGGGKAAIGIWHDDDKRFETEVRNQQLSFRGFTDGGIVVSPTCPIATAEITFEDCLFEACRRGVAFSKFNDYDYSFSGCEFLRCDTGIDCVHGNFYARDCHFEGSKIEDIHSAPEHACSVRRCTSIGSARFLNYESSVGTMTVQDCWVDGWTNPSGAVRLSGAPIMLFDCHFTRPPATAQGPASPISAPSDSQRLILSENVAPPGVALVQSSSRAHIVIVPPGVRKGVVTSPEQCWLRAKVRVPRRVFDARRDFGAKGDGVTDDTGAVQAAIDAAATAGKDSLAYLPFGAYVISRTLNMTGADYFVGGGGSGAWTRILWRGPSGGTMIKVRSPRNIVLENIAVGHNDQADHDVGIDIDQTGDGKGSRMTYDGVWVYGCYQRDPFRRGLCLSNLGALDTVVIQEMQGNIRLSECGGALILANNTCEGAVVVDGSKGPRDGFLGFQFRLATLVTHPLYLRDSNSIVMSDLYVEQADSGLFFAGRDGDPPGRATIQGAKLNTGGHPVESANFRAFDIDNYHGKIFFGHDQFYIEPNPLPFHQTGSNPVDLYVYACTFYDTLPALDITPAARVAFMSNLPFGMRKASYDAADVDAKRTCADLPAALDDLRRLGWADLHLNFP